MKFCVIKGFSALMAFLTAVFLSNITVHTRKMELSLSLCLDGPSQCNDSAVFKGSVCLSILIARGFGHRCAQLHGREQVHQVNVHTVLQMFIVPAAFQKWSLRSLKLSRQGQTMSLKI